MATKKKATTKKKTTLQNPKVGQFVWDKHYKSKKKVQSKNKNGLYFIGTSHEPVRRTEFIFPLPTKK